MEKIQHKSSKMKTAIQKVLSTLITCSIVFGGNIQTSNASHLTVSDIPTAPYSLKLVQQSKKYRKDWATRISKPLWTSMPMSLKKQRMKSPTSSLPTLDFKIWVPKWVPKQKNRPSEISESLFLSHFQTYLAIG